MRLEYSDRAEDYVNSGRSKFEMGINLGVQPSDNWLIEADWNLYAGRKMVVRESINFVDESDSGASSITGSVSDISLKTINELNLKACYTINSTISAYAGLYNIVNQKYDLYYGMPAEGFNFKVGAVVNF